MSKHTPKPWSINEWPHSNADMSVGAKGTPRIAVIPLRNVSINEQKANAHLIAAAPEMLEALKAVDTWFSSPSPSSEEHLDWLSFCDNQLNLVRQAIAKAKGK